MPNYKVFQDNADQMRVKIYGSNDTALHTDASGDLTVTSAGLAVTGVIDVGTVEVTSAGLAVTGVIDVGTVEVTSAGLAVTGVIDVGTVTVTTGSDALAVCIGTGDTIVKVNDVATTDIAETIADMNSTTYSGATARTVLGENAWTFAVKNNTLDDNAQAVVQIQMSATAFDESDWVQEVAPITINQNSVVFLTSSLLVKYARVYYKAVDTNSAVTLSIVYQAQK